MAKKICLCGATEKKSAFIGDRISILVIQKDFFIEAAKCKNENIKNLKSIGVRDEMGGQGQYRVGRGSIGWAGAVSAVPLPKSDFQHIKKVF